MLNVFHLRVIPELAIECNCWCLHVGWEYRMCFLSSCVHMHNIGSRQCPLVIQYLTHVFYPERPPLTSLFPLDTIHRSFSRSFPLLKFWRVQSHVLSDSDLCIRRPVQRTSFEKARKALGILAYRYNLSAKIHTLQKEIDDPCIHSDNI